MDKKRWQRDDIVGEGAPIEVPDGVCNQRETLLIRQEGVTTGGGVQIDIAFTTTDANSITKVTGYAADGTELGYWIIWTD